MKTTSCAAAELVGADFRIVGSEVSTEFGTNALLLVEGERLRLRFVSDRGQLRLELQPLHRDPSTTRDWRGAYRVRRLVTPDRVGSGVLDEYDALFVEEHLAEIEGMFSSDEWPATHERLTALGRVVAKELFG